MLCLAVSLFVCVFACLRADVGLLVRVGKVVFVRVLACMFVNVFVRVCLFVCVFVCSFVCV